MSGPENIAGQHVAGRPRRLTVVAGVAALAVAAAALVGITGDAVAEESDAPRAEMARAEMARAEMTRARMGEGRMAHGTEARAEHLAELAEQVGIDPDALRAAMEAVRADLEAEREALHETLADLDSDARRDAMQAFAEGRRAAMVDALVELGIDPEVLAQHRADAAHERPERERGPRHQRSEHRMAGPHGRI